MSRLRADPPLDLLLELAAMLDELALEGPGGAMQ